MGMYRVRSKSKLPDDAIERFQQVADLIDQAIFFKRRVVRGLWPAALEALGLEPALKGLTLEFRTRCECDLTQDIELGLVAPHEVALAAYRVTQAALAPLESMAAPRRVDISARRENDHLVLGIAASAGSGPAMSDTFDEWRWRILSLGGSCELSDDAQPAGGTGWRVDCRVPMAGPPETAP